MSAFGKSGHLRINALVTAESLITQMGDLVWEAWDSGLISDELAAWAWLVIAV